MAATRDDERQFERFDARPGGSYRMVLTYTDASTAPGKSGADSDIVEGRFVDLVPGVRVVQAIDFVSDDPAYAGTMTMTWEVAAVESGTRVDIRADDVPVGRFRWRTGRWMRSSSLLTRGTGSTPKRRP